MTVMLRNVFLKSLHDQRRALLGWGIGVALLVFTMAAFWPSIRDMPDLDEFLESYPEVMRDLFGLEDYATGVGYMNAELFTLMVPLLFIIFGIGRGARMIAGEEEAGTLEVLLVTPVSAVSVVLQKAAALAVATFALGAVLFGSALGSSAALDMGVGAADLAPASLAMVLLGLEYGWLALAVGAIAGRRSVAIGVSATAAVAAYVLYAAGELVHSVEPWQPLSPFHQALNGGPLGAGLPAAYALLGLAGLAAVAVALPIFDRRDIATQ